MRCNQPWTDLGLSPWLLGKTVSKCCESSAQSDACLSLSFDSVDGGELFDRITDEKCHLTELDVVLFTRQICTGVLYLHQHYILHLDLKVSSAPELGRWFLSFSHSSLRALSTWFPFLALPLPGILRRPVLPPLRAFILPFVTCG
jgi:serine/threonine protein kinase